MKRHILTLALVTVGLQPLDAAISAAALDNKLRRIDYGTRIFKRLRAASLAGPDARVQPAKKGWTSDKEFSFTPGYTSNADSEKDGSDAFFGNAILSLGGTYANWLDQTDLSTGVSGDLTLFDGAANKNDTFTTSVFLKAKRAETQANNGQSIQSVEVALQHDETEIDHHASSRVTAASVDYSHRLSALHATSAGVALAHQWRQPRIPSPDRRNDNHASRLVQTFYVDLDLHPAALERIRNPSPASPRCVRH